VSDPDRAPRIARDHRGLCDERAARMLLERFKPLPLDSRPRAEAAARAAGAIAAVDRGDECRAIALRLSGILDHVAGRPKRADRRLSRAAELLHSAGRFVEAGDIQRILIDVRMRS
jgi:hypothetical protein